MDPKKSNNIGTIDNFRESQKNEYVNAAMEFSNNVEAPVSLKDVLIYKKNLVHINNLLKATIKYCYSNRFIDLLTEAVRNLKVYDSTQKIRIACEHYNELEKILAKAEESCATQYTTWIIKPSRTEFLFWVEQNKSQSSDDLEIVWWGLKEMIKTRLL